MQYDETTSVSTITDAILTETAITGLENGFEKGSPVAALHSFYQAFNAADLQQMAQNWLQSHDASMSNPLGGIRRGWQEISSVYEKIFSGKARVYVEFYDYSIQQGDQIFCAVGRERGYFLVDETKLDLAIRTTRIYRKHDDCWLQLHHHGSIENPELLKQYQSRVLDAIA